MTVEGSAAVSRPSGTSSIALIFGWVNLAVLGAFLINNFLVNAFDWPGTALFSPATGGLAWVQFGLYAGAVIAGAVFAFSRRDVALRDEANRVSHINTFFIRWAFWMVLIVGVVDVTITFLRVEGFLEQLFGADINRDLGLPHYRGVYIHVPLMIISIFFAMFTRTLGFVWLALLIVIAELLIVFSRFLFSYEQPFMADLVRFWYGALFLFASAYTLLEEGHVRVDVFYASFASRTKGAVNAVGAVTMGILFCWTILIVGMGSKAAIINSPVFNFEVTQSAAFGMFVKYLMAGFLGIFAISMMIQFVSGLFAALADWRDDPGGVEHTGAHAS
ncbi:MAG: TRAP transporter small permease subunit [Rhizobiaceae bacterium]|nr:TRAP transporter small permease subunit [Rhizobiaceae bacterium]